jgi:hypothetical protein
VSLWYSCILALCDGLMGHVLMMENYVCSCTYALFDMCDSCCDSLWNVSCFRRPMDFVYKEHDFCAGVVRERGSSLELKNWNKELT